MKWVGEVLHVMMGSISPTVDCNSKDNENLSVNIHISESYNEEEWSRTHYDGNDLQQTKPIFKLTPSLATNVDFQWLTAYFTVYPDCCNVGQNQ